LKRELDRMVDNIKAHKFTDIFFKRLGIGRDEAKRYGFDPDTPSHYSSEEVDKFKKSLGREEKKGEKFLTEEEGTAMQSEEVAKRHAEEALVFGRGRKSVIKGFNRTLGGFSKYGEQTGFSIVLALIGVVVGAILGWPFLVGFASWAARNVIPNPKKLTMVKDWDQNRFGSLFSKSGDDDYNNRYSVGLATMKSLLKISTLFFFGWGFFVTELEFRGFMLLAFFFSAYFSLPGEYSTAEPQKMLEGLLRIPIALILSFVVLWGIFGSGELAWICMAFFAVFPVATERKNLARAIGQAGSGVTATFEMFDKLLFVVLMFGALISTMGLFGMGEGGLALEFGTVFGNVFFWFWIIAFLGGVMSPAVVRPHTGIIMLLMVFFFYSAGVGGQVVGQGFFGAWWPTVHNTISAVTEPMGELFATLGTTFGNTFQLFINPMGFARGIMDGTYEPNPYGPTGSFGVEIENLQIPAIYPGTKSMVTFNIKNVGPVKARNVIVKLELPGVLKGVKMSKVLVLGPDKASDGAYDSGDMDELGVMEPNDIIPMFFVIDARDCEKIMEVARDSWIDEKLDLDDRLNLRNMYIRANVSVEYDYEVSSWMPLTIISKGEWRERTSRGTFVPGKVSSHISTSPAMLSIGSFDQPLVTGDDRPFYMGFNMTSAEGRDSAILWDNVKVKLDYPSELGSLDKTDCQPSYARGGTEPPYEWDGKDIKNRAVFCMFDKTPDPFAPSKTYYISANSSFRFSRWEIKDTLFAFSDICRESFGLPESDV
jgi:hypothetical protein